MNKRICSTVLAVAFAAVAMAQSGTNSPYSQFGFGILSEQNNGFNRGMNGLGIGFRDHNQVNFLNPASYSSVDSLTFIFDAGVSLQLTNFEENGIKKNARNSNFDYVAAEFRVMPHFGVSFGLLPFSNIGYNYSYTGYLDNKKSTSYTNTYSGSGGLHQVFLGAGVELFKGLSIGANFSYLWGSFTRSVVNSYNDAYINTLSKSYSADVRSYKLDAGLQYQLKVSKDDQLTIGATYTMGHKLGCDPECRVISVNPQTSVSDTTKYVLSNGFELPTMIGAGFSLNHANRLRVGADYTLQKWGSVSFPEYSVVNDEPQYALQSDYFKDRHKVTVGADYCNNEQSRRFIDRVHFRAGASYATPYLKINGQDGPKELSVSAGFGIPIINRWYERERSRGNISMLNISAQWVQRSAASLIKENTFRINVGVTFNERWFAKWKVE